MIKCFLCTIEANSNKITRGMLSILSNPIGEDIIFMRSEKIDANNDHLGSSFY